MFPAGKYLATTKEEPSDAMAFPTPNFWVLFHTIAVKWPGWWATGDMKETNEKAEDKIECEWENHWEDLVKAEVSVVLNIYRRWNLPLSHQSQTSALVWSTLLPTWISVNHCKALWGVIHFMCDSMKQSLRQWENHLGEFGQSGNDIWAEEGCYFPEFSPWLVTEQDRHTLTEVWHQHGHINDLTHAWIHTDAVKVTKQKKWEAKKRQGDKWR